MLIIAYKFTKKANAQFWKHHPALLYGMAASAGTFLALFPISLFLTIIFSTLLSIPLLNFVYRCISNIKNVSETEIRFALAMMVAIGCFYCVKYKHQIPELDENQVEGVAEVDLTALVQSKTPFGIQWLYIGTLNAFTPVDASDSIARNIPISVMVPLQQERVRPLAGYKYLLKSILKIDSNGNHRISPIKSHPWKRIKKIMWNFAERRIHLKLDFQTHINSIYKDSYVSSFIAGIATGIFDDRLLAFELNRFGLQHLMAISGLHFAILTSFLFFGVTLLFPRKIGVALLLLLLSSYFLFLGATPSVFRAWISAAVALSATFLEKPPRGLNSLGIALFAALIWNPFWLQQLGFQFSFIITAGILLFASPCDELLKRFFPKRKLSQMVKLGWVDQHGYCLLHLLRKGVSLTLAVNLTALPLALYYFHKFPLMGLIYNLFFPFLVTISILLLILALASALIIPCLGHVLHTINASYTKFILNFVFNLPKSFDYTIYFSSFTFDWIFCYMLLLFSIGVLLYRVESEEVWL
jgi:competence protein ComEC